MHLISTQMLGVDVYIIVQIYMIAVAICYVLLWIRHFRFVYKLYIYVLEHHMSEWKIIKREYPNWLGLEAWPSSAMFTFYSRAVYNFVWRSEETFGDPYILSLRRRIRRFVWELPLYFVVVTVTALLLVWSGILR